MISRDIWDDVHNILNSRQKYSIGIPKEGRYLFSGVLVCDICSNKMYVKPYKSMTIPRYVCNKCGNKIWEDALVKHFIHALRDIIVQPELLMSPNDYETESLIAKKVNEIDVLKREKNKLVNQIDKLFELHTDEGITKEVFSERYRPLEDRRLKIREELARVQIDIEQIQMTETGRLYLVDQAQTLGGMWEVLNVDERRRIIRELLSQVKVGEDTLNFVFTFLPQLMENKEELLGEENSSKLATHIQGFMAATSITRAG